MVLCDTNILIHSFNGEEETIEKLNSIGLEQIVLSSITVMELFQGMGNKFELRKMKRKIQYFDIAEINIQTSKLATVLIEDFKLSHGLQIPLFTYNTKDFNFMPDIILM